MTRTRDTLVASLQQVLAAELPDPQHARYCVAFSGGLDSSVLLASMQVLCADWPGARLRAVHINHGLYADAGRWQEEARVFAAKLDIDFLAVGVAVPADSPKGIEAAARDARYQALADALANDEILLCAHHLDDQLETFLLQLLRGAGPAGLAAMPVARKLGPGLLLRPLLSLRRDELKTWASERSLAWCEDTSNQDQQFDRNFLRHRVLPSIRERWPSAAGSVARSAALCAEADQLLKELASQDLEAFAAENVGNASVLSLAGREGFDEARLSNLLRSWIKAEGYPLPGYDQLREIITSLIPAKADAEPVVRWAGNELRRYREALYLMPAMGDIPETILEWDTSKALRLPGLLGDLVASPATGQAGRGAIAGHLLEQQCTVRFRVGGEQFRPVGGRQRPLKKCLQEEAIPPWLRSRLPLVFCAGRLAWVPGLGCAEELLAKPGEDGRIICWNRPSGTNS